VQIHELALPRSMSSRSCRPCTAAGKSSLCWSWASGDGWPTSASDRIREEPAKW